MTDKQTIEVESEAKAEIASKKTVQVLDASETVQLWRAIAKVAPDILDVAAMTLTNPLAGLGMTVKRIAEKAKSQTVIEGQIQDEATKKFFASMNSEENKVPTDQDNLQKPDYISDAMIRVAEHAVKLNDQKLMNEVLEFYKDYSARLIRSQIEGVPDTALFAKIWAELGTVRLKVMWADAQREARHSKKIEEQQKLLDELGNVTTQEGQLQLRVFLLLLLYVSIIALVILVGSSSMTSATPVPLLGIPVPMVLWSALGSIANLLFRYYKHPKPRNVEQELRWVWARPLVGIIMGTVLYLVITSGLTILGAVTPQNETIQLKTELLCLFAFVGGFSDRIFEGVIDKIGLISIPEKATDESLARFLQIYTEDLAQKTNGSVDDSVAEQRAALSQSIQEHTVLRTKTSGYKQNDTVQTRANSPQQKNGHRTA